MIKKISRLILCVTVAFMQENERITFTYSPSGSGAGIKAV